MFVPSEQFGQLVKRKQELETKLRRLALLVESVRQDQRELVKGAGKRAQQFQQECQIKARQIQQIQQQFVQQQARSKHVGRLILKAKGEINDRGNDLQKLMHSLQTLQSDLAGQKQDEHCWEQARLQLQQRVRQAQQACRGQLEGLGQIEARESCVTEENNRLCQQILELQVLNKDMFSQLRVRGREVQSLRQAFARRTEELGYLEAVADEYPKEQSVVKCQTQLINGLLKKREGQLSRIYCYRQKIEALAEQRQRSLQLLCSLRDKLAADRV